MSAGDRRLQGILLAAVFLALAVLACGPVSDGEPPGVTILSPAGGATVMVGEAVEIVSEVVADAGVVRVELLVNDQLVREDAPLDGNPATFAVIQAWTPEVEGEARVSVVAYDTSENAGAATIAVRVAADAAEAAPSKPVEDVESSAGCTLNASYVADVTVPDNTKVEPGAEFVKTWRIRNSGTCDWTAGFNLVFVSGDQLGGEKAVAVSDTPAGGTTDVSVKLVASDNAGEYRSNWQMRSDEGRAFGSTLYVQIVVAGARIVESTEEPTDEPPEEPTEAPPTTSGGEVCRGGDPVVALLVDPALEDGIRSGLNRFEADLCDDGYAVIERLSDYGNPPEIRAYLADLYDYTQRHLVGAILIGDLPHAYQWLEVTYTNPDIPPTTREVISFQYYADLDGIFDTSPGYTSPGGYTYSYDVHSGDVDWEIWVGVLPLYKGNPATTVDALNRYFDKNHAYRTGGYDLPRTHLEIDEHAHATTAEEHDQLLDGMRSGQYAWTPFSEDPDAQFFFDSSPGGLSVDQGYETLSTGVADFTVLSAHGTPSGSGRMNIGWVESHPVRTAFFVDGACSAGNLDYADNILTAVLYSSTSEVVLAEGTTSESGGMGTNEDGFYGHNIATALSAGESFGRAMVGHVNVPLIYPWSESREEHFAEQVILGDPTLTIQ
jgi:hypothetical protein